MQLIHECFLYTSFYSNSPNDSSAEIPVENLSDHVNISSVLDDLPVDQPLNQPSETSPMDDDSPTPLEDSTMDQDSRYSTIQDYASVSEENTMELFTEPQTSCPTRNGRKDFTYFYSVLQAVLLIS